MVNNLSQGGTSNDTRTIVTVLLLIFVAPIGLIVMWIWTKWPVYLKFIISIPAILIILFFIIPTISTLINPERAAKMEQEIIQKAELTSTPQQ